MKSPFRSALATTILVLYTLTYSSVETSASRIRSLDQHDRTNFAREIKSHMEQRAPAAGMRAAPLGKRKSRSKKRDASTVMSAGDGNTEGENHSPVAVPYGAALTSLQVQPGTSIAAFWSQSPDNSSAEQAFVMIHGKIRDGNDYWTTMNNILQSAVSAGYPGASDKAIVTAPQFYSTILNSGQYGDSELAWPDVNAWQAGDPANHPSSTTQTSFDALDAFVAEFSDQSKYPSMRNLTFVGHGGGGQLISRYAMIAKDAPCNLHIRYISGDPSSNAYFTSDRPVNSSDPNAIQDCPTYNTWRYGFDNFTGTSEGLLTPQQYFTRYTQRDFVSIVGLQDTDDGGDQYCMAAVQGGTARRDRNLCWWQYLNALAGTDEVLDAFPCQYNNLPDWSNLTNHAIGTRLTVVEDADHNAEEVYTSDEGRSALFSSGDILVGWRPEGWQAGTGKYTPGAVSCNTATSTTSLMAAGATGVTTNNANTNSSSTNTNTKASSVSSAPMGPNPLSWLATAWLSLVAVALATGAAIL